MLSHFLPGLIPVRGGGGGAVGVVGAVAPTKYKAGGIAPMFAHSHESDMASCLY